MADTVVDFTSANSAITTYESTTKKTPSNEMDKDGFLKLLVAQLTHQDPTNPMQDTEFVSQLTQYSGLEQQINMNKTLEKMVSLQTQSQLGTGINCIGGLIGYIDDKGKPQSKVCQFVDMYDGVVELYFADGSHIPLSKVEQVGRAPVSTPTTPDPDPEDPNPDE